MVDGHSLLRAGHGRIDRVNTQYAQTSSSIETTAHRLASKGTTDGAAKLAATEALAIGVFDYNLNEPPYNSTSEIFDSKMSQNGKDVIIQEPEDLFTFLGILDDGESVTKHKLGTYEPATGKLQGKAATQIAAVVFQESLAASGADEYIEAVLIGSLGGLSPVTKVETVTISTNAATLSYQPIGLTTVKTLGSSGNTEAATIMHSVSSTALVAGAVSWTAGTKNIKTSVTDTLTQLTAVYTYLPGNE